MPSFFKRLERTDLHYGRGNADSWTRVTNFETDLDIETVRKEYEEQLRDPKFAQVFDTLAAASVKRVTNRHGGPSVHPVELLREAVSAFEASGGLRSLSQGGGPFDDGEQNAFIDGVLRSIRSLVR